jgi:hypothetical protein
VKQNRNRGLNWRQTDRDTLDVTTGRKTTGSEPMENSSTSREYRSYTFVFDRFVTS